MTPLPPPPLPPVDIQVPKYDGLCFCLSQTTDTSMLQGQTSAVEVITPSDGINYENI